jgi:hypothetical protein
LTKLSWGFDKALLRAFDHPLHNIITFIDLTDSLITRFVDFRARKDLDHVISHYRHLYSLPREVVGIERIDVLGNLTMPLHDRFKFEGRLEDIEDSISLLRPVITMVSPGTDYYHFIISNGLRSLNTLLRLSAASVLHSHLVHSTIPRVVCLSTVLQIY